MANGFKWSIDWDANPLKRGAQVASDAIEDAADVFEDFAKTADKATDKIGDNLGDEVKDGTKKAEKAVERLEDEFRSAFNKIEEKSQKTGKGIGKDFDEGTRRAAVDMDELAKNADSNAQEMATSFDGSLDGIVEYAQEMVSEISEVMGMKWAPLGIAAAAGIGLLVTSLQKSAEEAAESKERMIEFADAIREADGDISKIDWAGRFREFGNEIADAASWFEPWQKAAKTNFEVLEEEAERFGLTYTTLFQGMAGDTDQATTALEEIEGAISAAESELARMEEREDRMSQAQRDARAETRGQIDDLNGLKDKLQEASGVTDEAIEHQELMEKAYRNSAAGIRENNEELVEFFELTSQAINTELDLLDAVEQGTAALQENATAGLDKTTAAGRENLRTVSEMAGAYLDHAESILEVSGNQDEANAILAQGRDQLVGVMKQFGMTEAQANDYINRLGLIPKQVSTTATAETRAAETALTNVARPRTVPIYAEVDTTEAQIRLNRLAAQQIKVSVQPTVSVMKVV